MLKKMFKLCDPDNLLKTYTKKGTLALRIMSTDRYVCCCGFVSSTYKEKCPNCGNEMDCTQYVIGNYTKSVSFSGPIKKYDYDAATKKLTVSKGTPQASYDAKDPDTITIRSSEQKNTLDLTHPLRYAYEFEYIFDNNLCSENEKEIIQKVFDIEKTCKADCLNFSRSTFCEHLLLEGNEEDILKFSNSQLINLEGVIERLSYRIRKETEENAKSIDDYINNLTKRYVPACMGKDYIWPILKYLNRGPSSYLAAALQGNGSVSRYSYLDDSIICYLTDMVLEGIFPFSVLTHEENYFKCLENVSEFETIKFLKKNLITIELCKNACLDDFVNDAKYKEIPIGDYSVKEYITDQNKIYLCNKNKPSRLVNKFISPANIMDDIISLSGR